MVKQSGSGKRHQEVVRQRALKLYREGYGEEEIYRILNSETARGVTDRKGPKNTISTWVSKAKRERSDFEIEHIQGMSRRKVGQPFTVWKPAGTEIPLVRTDLASGERETADWVFTDPDIYQSWLREWNRNWQGVAQARPGSLSQYNLHLLIKLRFVDGLGLRQVAIKYKERTNRSLSYSTVRRLLARSEFSIPEDSARRTVGVVLCNLSNSYELANASPRVVSRNLVR